LFVSVSGCQTDASGTSENTGAVKSIEVAINGVVHPEDRYEYLTEPFEVPDGIERIEVEFEYDRSENAELEIGIYDPNGFRGTSRFSRSEFFIATHTATPAYYPGAIPAGTWAVSIGVPTVYAETNYSVDIRMHGAGTAATRSGPWARPARDSAGWYQGDLHSHTGHSDGYGCQNGQGERAPCQVSQNIGVARDRGLDFVAVTDHNTTSHHNEMVAHQYLHDDLLLLPGQEVTTFYGHANVFGAHETIDFSAPKDELFASIIGQVNERNGLVSLNHPGRETGDACTGCGWNMPHTDYAKIDAIEVVNGTDVESSTAGKWFWYDRLNEGYRIAGIAGSDDHSGGRGSNPIGTPTTVIYADELSEKGLFEGIRSGRVFIKTRGPDGPNVILSAADQEGDQYLMGDELPVATGKEIRLSIDVTHGEGHSVHLIKNGEEIDLLEGATIKDGNVRFNATVEGNDEDAWYLVELRDESGGLAVITNPIYIATQ
jgi:predicted metal-dependent phosphoesterase TrpH